jgi:hypothetical protein
MAAITKAMPIYDAILALATDDERVEILAAGDRWELDDKSWGSDMDQATRALAVIKEVLARASERSDLRFTGINRALAMARGPVDAEDVVTGRLIWDRPDGRTSKLFLDSCTPTIRIDNLQVEPLSSVAIAAPPAIAKLPAEQLRRERIDDSARLAEMLKYYQLPMLRQQAAKRVVQNMPGCRTTQQEDTIVKRLMRKFARLQ